MRNLVQDTLKFKKLSELQGRSENPVEHSMPYFTVLETSTDLASFYYSLYALCVKLMGHTEDSAFHFTFNITAVFLLTLETIKKLLDLKCGHKFSNFYH